MGSRPRRALQNISTQLPALITRLQATPGSQALLPMDRLEALSTNVQNLEATGVEGAVCSRSLSWEACVSQAGCHPPAALPIAVSSLEEQISREGVSPIYGDVKSYLCCTVSNSANSLFLSWTLTGALGFLLCILVSTRVMAHTVSNRRRRG